MMPAYLTAEQTSALLERSLEQIVEMMSIGQLLTIALPGEGLVVPLATVPPVAQVSEEDG